MSAEAPNMWDWLCNRAPWACTPVAAFLLGASRDEIKRRYYQTVAGRRGLVGLWLCRMIGEYRRQFPAGEIPENYPVGHRFERIADLATAFPRKEPSMSYTPAPPWHAYPPADDGKPCGLYPSEVRDATRAALSTASQLEQAEQYAAELKAKLKEEAKAAEARAKAEAEQAAAAQAREDLKARLDYERGLAGATVALLAEIADIALYGGRAIMSPTFAKYHTELAPLAATYGFKIVLVGDKSVAVLTK